MIENVRVDSSAVEAALQQTIGRTVTEIRTHPVVLAFSGVDSPPIELAPTEDAAPDDELFLLCLPEKRVLTANQSGLADVRAVNAKALIAARCAGGRSPSRGASSP